MKIGNLMNTNLHTVNRECSLLDAARKMKRFDIGSLLIIEDEKLVGIITDRDIVLFFAKTASFNSTVAEAMSTNVKTLSSDSTIEDLIDLMGYMQIRRVPIVDNGKVSGIICLSDLVRQRFSRLATDALAEISFDPHNSANYRPQPRPYDEHTDYI